MKQIPAAEAQEGMVLGRDILDDQGRTILGAGTTLSHSHCRMLTRREIELLTIIETDAEAGAQAAQAISEEAQADTPDPQALKRMADIEHMFSDVMDDPLMRELFRLALEHAKQGVIHA